MTRLGLIAVFLALPLAAEKFTYSAHWRFFDAGRATIEFGGSTAALSMATHGTVGALHPVDDHYTASFRDGLCTAQTVMDEHQGDKKRETKVEFGAGKARLTEKDLVSGQSKSSELVVPGCVHDVVASLARLREMRMEPGDETTLPLSDGRKYVQARVAAQKVERVKTPAGEFTAVRHEAFLYNGTFYRRKGRLFVWLTNDARRLPVQIKVELPFYIGDVTLKLERAVEALARTADLRR